MRADKFFAEKFGSRTKASEIIGKGYVLRDGKPLKPSDNVNSTDFFEFIQAEQSFVSNGGYKLARALEVFGSDISGKVWVDIGASNGGFTDCLLQNGARCVYCVDVGESQLNEVLASDERVFVMDRTNARYLTKDMFPIPPFGVVSDVSFISLKLILPAVAELLDEGGLAFVLIKPQFEVGKGKLGKSGIVSKGEHPSVLRGIYRAAMQLNLSPVNVTNAPIRAKKNVEYVALLKKDGCALSEDEFVLRATSVFQNE